MSDHDQRDDYDDQPFPYPLARKEIVAWPASAMWVFGLMQCIITQVGLVFFASLFVVTGLDDGKSIREILLESAPIEDVLLFLAVWLTATACSLHVMWAGNSLRSFRRYPLVWAGTILTFLSVPFIYLGIVSIPLSIWIAVLLLRRDVRARFEAISRGKIVEMESNNAEVAESEGSFAQDDFKGD